MAYQNYSGAWLPDTNQAGLQFVRGGAWAEYLTGSSGADEFDGGGGLDTFAGGAGDDFYWVPSEANPVIEYAGQGIDTVKIWSSYALPQNVENLICFGNNQYAAGNDLNNIIQGQDGTQFIYGGRGEDVLIGGGGSDDFIVAQGEGSKVIQDFQPGSDHLRLIGGNLTTFDAVKSAMTQQGSDVVLNNGGTMVLFRNMTIGQFQARDFQLPLNYQALGTPTFSEEFNTLHLLDPNNPSAGGLRPDYGFGGLNGIQSYTLQRNGEQEIYANPRMPGSTGQALGLNPFSIDNGVLTIKAEKVSADIQSKIWGYQYTSGMVSTDVAFQQTYGYFEMRAELPQGQGFWPAFWLISTDGTGNELDVLEGLGSNTKLAYNAAHGPGTFGDLSHASFNPYGTGMHTYGVLWSPSDLVWYVDGAEVWRTATPANLNTKMYMVANLAVGGNWPGSPDATTPWPGTMKIDYIRAYGLPGTTTAPPVTPPVTPPTTPSTGGGTTSGSGVINVGQAGETVSGSSGADTFVFANKPWSPAHITNFQVGVDKLDLSALLKQVGYSGSDPVADKYIWLMDNGAGGTKILFDKDGAAAGQLWPDRIIELDGVPVSSVSWSTLTGGAATGGSTGGSTGGTSGGGTSTGTGVTLTSSKMHDVLVGGAGNDVINVGQGGDTVTGGGGADSFVFANKPWEPAHITDFQLGTDKLDLSALLKQVGYSGSDPVADKYVWLMDNGAGGTKILFDRDGAANGQQWPDRIIELDGVSVSNVSWAKLTSPSGATGSTGGGSTGGTSTGGTAGQVITANGINATLTGGAGNDTINASQSNDVITGGAGNDVFHFGSKPWSPSHITDFQVGQDKLDVHDILQSFGYSGSNPIGDKYMWLLDDGAGGTKVLFDRDGAAGGQQWPDYAINIDHVSVSTLTSSSGWLIS